MRNPIKRRTKKKKKTKSKCQQDRKANRETHADILYKSKRYRHCLAKKQKRKRSNWIKV